MMSKVFILSVFSCFIFQLSSAMDNQPSNNGLFSRVISGLCEKSEQSRQEFLRGYLSHTQQKQNPSTPIKTNSESDKQNKQRK